MNITSPAHDTIAQRAHEIWQIRGQPSDRDTAIWLEAEQQLLTSTTLAAPTLLVPESRTEPAGRLQAETAAESVVEFHLPSSTSEDAAVRAALPFPESRGTPAPGKTPPQLAAAAEVRGTSTSQSTTTPATNPSPAPRPAITTAQAQQQKKSARSPQIAVSHPAHTLTPPESGKPLWDKPHSQ